MLAPAQTQTRPVKRIDFTAQPGQAKMLLSSADITIGGGAAGGGKTWAILIEPLKHCKVKGFGAVVFRRMYSEITKTGGMWDESKGIYPFFGAKPNNSELSWKFPSGATITFGNLHSEDSLQDWRGSQIACLEFDQLETFSEQQFFYMLSRNRSVCGVKPYVKASCNPEPGWLANFLDWWIAEDGYADMARVGVLRWFVRISNEIHWGDTRAELVERFPEQQPTSVTFIPASVYDNKILMDKDPGYISRLKSLPMIDRERLLGDPIRGGNWKIKPSAGKIFNRSWFPIVDAAPAGGRVVRRWDFAATERQINKSDPDYTASVLMLEIGGAFYILDMTADQIGPAEIERRFENITVQDKTRFSGESRQYMARWEQEPGSAGKRETWRMVKKMAGIDARGVPSSGDKLTRARPLAAQAEAGNVYLLRGAWNEAFLNHMHGQPDLPHDDIMDAAAGAFSDLTAPGVTAKAKSWQG